MGANEKRMRTHPFSAALQSSGNQQVSCARAQASHLVGQPTALPGIISPMAGIARHRRAQTALLGCRPSPPSVTPALDGQALTALRAASVDDFATARGLHANTEAMGALAARHGRLIGTFHVALTRWRMGCGVLCKDLTRQHNGSATPSQKFGFRGTRYLNCFSLRRQYFTFTSAGCRPERPRQQRRTDPVDNSPRLTRLAVEFRLSQESSTPLGRRNALSHLRLSASHSFKCKPMKTPEGNRAVRVERCGRYDVATPQQTT